MSSRLYEQGEMVKFQVFQRGTEGIIFIIVDPQTESCSVRNQICLLKKSANNNF